MRLSTFPGVVLLALLCALVIPSRVLASFPAPSLTTHSDCELVIDQLKGLNKYWEGRSISNPQLLQRKCFDSHADLIQLHLKLVEEDLRCNMPETLSSEQRLKRKAGLDLLRQYWQAKQFPINNNHPGQVVPYFIDDFGTACAVGHLVRETGFETFAQRVQAENNYAYIEDMDYPELREWAAEYGFSEVELRWIQPSYGCWADRSDILVTNTFSSGVGSFSWAINEANNDPEPNTIRFNLPAGSIIRPTTQLWLSGTCDAIDGSLGVGEQVIIDGENYFGTNWGIVISADESDVRHLIIRGYNYTALGVWGATSVSLDANTLYQNQTSIQVGNGASGTRITFNTIGLDENGNNNQPLSSEQIGVWINDADNVTINNNVVAGFNELDEYGIVLDSDDPGTNFNICCNKFGTNEQATEVIPNHYGLYIGTLKSQVTVFNNTFGANDDSGVLVYGATDVDIFDNYFGVNEQGQLLMPGDTTGLWLGGGASNIDIYGNIIRGDQSTAWGIQVYEASDVRIGNGTEEGENIFTNCEVGIGINTSADISYLHNQMVCVDNPIYFVETALTEAPQITTASTSLVSGVAEAGATVDIYTFDPENCASCAGEAYVGSAVANATGYWEIPMSVSQGLELTAIATHNNSSSEFSGCAAIQSGTCTNPPAGTVLLSGHSYFHVEWDHEITDDCANAYEKRWRAAGQAWNTIIDLGSFPGPDTGDGCFCPTLTVVPPPYPGLFLNQLPPCTTYEAQIRWVNVEENGNVADAGDWSPVSTITTGSCTNPYFDTNCYAVPDRQPCVQVEAFQLDGIFFLGGEDSAECGGEIGDFGYDFYSGVTLNVNAGQNHALTYNVTNTGQYNDADITSEFRVKAWIDFNSDGDYEDANELVFNDVNTSVLNVSQAFTSNLSIPSFSLGFSTRMRILLVDSDPITGSLEDPGPCDNYSAGHTREYNLTINPGNPMDLEPSDVLCLDWLRILFNENLMDLGLQGGVFVNFNEDEQIIIIGADSDFQDGEHQRQERYFFDVNGNELNHCFTDDNNSPTCSSYWETVAANAAYIWVYEAGMIPVCCEANVDEIMCSDWMQAELINLDCELCPDQESTIVYHRIYYAELDGQPGVVINTFCGNTAYSHRRFFDCDGILQYDCLEEDFSDCGSDWNDSIILGGLIWDCDEPEPDCGDTMTGCGLTQNEILCLPWMQELAEQDPEIEEIGMGIYNGETVVLVGSAYCPVGQVCTTPGVVDIYTCEGLLLVTYGTVVSDPDPDLPFEVLSVIYQIGDQLPQCWNIGNNCFQVSASIIQPSCPGLNDGVITTSIFGGQSPFSYAWSTGATSPNLSGLMPGNYTLTVTDASGCANSTVVGVSQNDGEAVALPDGTGASYQSTITFNQFPQGATIESPSDLVFVDLNLEHSYSGDLDIALICPDGTRINLLSFPSGLGSTNFGEPFATNPVDGESSDLTPGIPYTYRFVANAANGTIPAFDATAPSYIYTTVPSELTGETFTYTDTYIPAGEYEPVEPFASLVGCPLNGEWTIEVTDNLGLDNGWLFGWSIGFANGPQTQTITLDEQECDDGSYTLTASSYSIEPGETITLDYTADPLGSSNLLVYGNGESMSIANAAGSVQVTYDEPGVYRPYIRIDDQTVVRIAIQVRSCGWYGFVRGNNNYRESAEEICDLVTGDGRMYLPPSLTDRTYYWTSYENIRDFGISGDAATLEARIKVPASEGGVSCYDPQITIYGTEGIATARWMRTNCSYYSGIGAGSTYLSGSTTNLDALTADFTDWRVLKIEVENQTIEAFIDNELRYTLSYEGAVGEIIGLRFYAKGSGSIDWMRLYEANGTLAYEENFDDCSLNENESCLVNQELTFIANPTVGQGGTPVQVPITVRGFENIAGFSHTLSLESNVGMITGITPAAISPFSNLIDGQTAITAWDDPTGQGLSLPDDEVVFYVNVTLSTSQGLCGDLSFIDSPLPIGAFVWQGGNTVEINVSTENNPVCTMVDGGESCDDPIVISCGQTLAANSDFGGDLEEAYSCLDNLLNGKEVYFQFENPENQDIIITLGGLTSDLELLLLNDSCDPDGCLRSSDRTGTVDEVIYWENMPAGTYYLVVEGYLEASSSFLLSIECGDIPGGTLVCQDEALLCDGVTSGNNANGISNVIQYNCGSNDSYTAGPEYVYLIENPTSEPLIYVVTLQDHTADLDLFVLADCDRSSCFIASTNSGTEEESFILSVQPQSSYRVVVDGYNGATSAYNLVVDCFPSDEFVDLNCDDNQPITCGETISGNNGDGGYTGFSYCNDNYTNGPEDIYLFSNPYLQDVTILLTGLSQNLDVYLLDTCSVLNSCVGVGDKSGTSDEGLIIPNLPAGDYYIVVDGFDNGISDYELELQCVPREVEKSGRITKVIGDPVQDVQVLCNDDLETYSDEQGIYEFTPVLVGADYTIEPHKDINYRNGVDLLDIIRIRAHILGTTPLMSNYHLIAADVSNDAQIDVLDISRLYQLYLFMLDDWPDVESWRFVPKSFEFDGIPPNQDVPVFAESIELPALSEPAVDQDFYAVKMGDVTDDAAGYQLQAPQPSPNRNQTVEMHFPAEWSNDLQEIRIPVYSTNENLIRGLQLEIKVQEDLNILGVENVNLPGTLYQNSLENHNLLLAWDHPQAQDMSLLSSPEQPLFYVRLSKAQSTNWPEQILTLSENRMAAYVVNETLENQALQLLPSTLTNNKEAGLNNSPVVVQARPNPFSNDLTVDLRLPVGGPVTLLLWDASGRKCYHRVMDGQSGWSQMSLDSSLFPTSGVYFLQVSTQETVRYLRLVKQ